MKEDDLDIPAFLRRGNKEQTAAVATAMEKVMAQPPKEPVEAEKKKRNTVELPTSIDAGAGHIILEGLSLTELADHQATWKQKLADMPKIALELRAINQEIRRKAK